jgi:hypothetical protein
MTELKFNNDKRNPGFIGNLSHEEGLEIATKLNLPRGKSSDGQHNTGSHWCDKNEDILIETGYGISYNPDVDGLVGQIQVVLEELGYLLTHG